MSKKKKSILFQMVTLVSPDIQRVLTKNSFDVIIEFSSIPPSCQGILLIANFQNGLTLEITMPASMHVHVASGRLPYLYQGNFC